MLPEVAMDPNHKMTETKPQRPFWQQYLMVIGIDTVIVFVGSLILGDLRQMTNLYFWSTLILFIIAAVPVFTEIGTSAKIAGKASKIGRRLARNSKRNNPHSIAVPG